MYCNSRLNNKKFKMNFLSIKEDKSIFSNKQAMERGIGTIVSIILILLVIALVAWLLKKWVELELI